MRPGDEGVAAAVTKMNVLPLFSRAEQLPFKIPVHVPARVGIMQCFSHTSTDHAHAAQTPVFLMDTQFLITTL